MFFILLFASYELLLISVHQADGDSLQKDLSRTTKFLLKNEQQLLVTLFIGKYVSIAFAVYFLHDAFANYFHFKQEWWLVVLLVFLLILLLILFVDFLPKIITQRSSVALLNSFAWIISLFLITFYLFSAFYLWISTLLMKNMETDDNQESFFSHLNLNYLISDNATTNEVLSGIDNEVRIIQNVLDFSNVKLRDCLVPRTEIVALEQGVDIGMLKQTFVETGLSKILIYKEDLDNTVGYIHSSEMFKNPKDWIRQIKPIPIVPESMTAQKLMKILMKDKKSIALVVDEFGGTAGIVTLEDIVEEIFGEIEDEHDKRHYVAKQMSNNEYVLSGKLEIEEINENFNLGLPESDDYTTLAGYILQMHQHFPKLNEVVEIDRYIFKFLKVANNRIELVRLTIKEN